MGLVLCFLAASYGGWAAYGFADRGVDARSFDQPIVRRARSMVGHPAYVGAMRPRNNREFYLLTVISDQRDVMEGMTALALRLIIGLTVGGLGFVLLTAGATEWEIRSEYGGAGTPPPVVTSA